MLKANGEEPQSSYADYQCLPSTITIEWFRTKISLGIEFWVVRAHIAHRMCSNMFVCVYLYNNNKSISFAHPAKCRAMCLLCKYRHRSKDTQTMAQIDLQARNSLLNIKINHRIGILINDLWPF